MALVLMDVDGTLLPNPSSETRFIAHLATRGKLGPVQLAAAITFYLVYGRRFGKHVGRKNKAYLHHLRRTDVERLARRFVNDRLLPRLRPSVLERLRAHQRGGDTVVLLTGAPEFLAAPLAEALGVEHWCATQCAGNERRFGWRPPLQHPLGAQKLTSALRVCAQAQARLDETIAYADSIHDLDLLERVGRPVVVHPDRHLAAVARQRGWEQLGSAPSSPALKVSD